MRKYVNRLLATLDLVLGVVYLWSRARQQDYGGIFMVVGTLALLVTIAGTYGIYRFLFTYITKLINGTTCQVAVLKQVYGSQGLVLVAWTYLSLLLGWQERWVLWLGSGLIFVAYQLWVASHLEQLDLTRSKNTVTVAVLVLVTVFSTVVANVMQGG
ncbi:hypothetical protein PUF88_05400 [Lactobacillaceae bacterium L1_55_11]|nr:hypothetical protein [Lactobacillaceae bacterium L1_55_11]